MDDSNASVSACMQGSFTAEMFPTEPQVEEQGSDDTNLEWLSIFMEDCLSGNTTFSTLENLSPTSNPTAPAQPENPKNSSPCDMKLPAKARTKKKRKVMNFIEEDNCPLLPPTYWLADSELILPQKLNEDRKKAEAGGDEVGKQQGEGQTRKCTHCLSQKTPQWRAGPMGPKTLCNACGVRFKSGRLLPEYRPAKSPTFVSYKHSNSHKKVMEMRMASLSSKSS